MNKYWELRGFDYSKDTQTIVAKFSTKEAAERYLHKSWDSNPDSPSVFIKKSLLHTYEDANVFGPFYEPTVDPKL